MFIFVLGTLVGMGCVAVYNEMYTRWLYRDILKRSEQLGITEERMKKAIVAAACDEIERGFNGQNH